MKLTPKERLEGLEAVFTALAHPSRRQILMTVHFRNGMTAGDIAQRFHHAWPTISRHLGVLRNAGLLTQEKQGRTRLYRVDHERLALVREWMGWFDDPGPAAKKVAGAAAPAEKEKTHGSSQEEQ